MLLISMWLKLSPLEMIKHIIKRLKSRSLMTCQFILGKLIARLRESMKARVAIQKIGHMVGLNVEPLCALSV